MKLLSRNVRGKPELPTEPQTHIGAFLEAKLSGDAEGSLRLEQVTARGRTDWVDGDETAVIEALADLLVRRYSELGASTSDVLDVVQRHAHEGAASPPDLWAAMVAFLADEGPRPDVTPERAHLLALGAVTAIADQLPLTPAEVTVLVIEAEELAMLRGFGPGAILAEAAMTTSDGLEPQTEMGRRLVQLLPPRRAPVTSELIDELQRITWGRNLLKSLTTVALSERFPLGMPRAGIERVVACFPATREDPDGHRYIGPQAGIVALQAMTPRPARVNVPVLAQTRIRLRIAWLACEWLGIDDEHQANRLVRTAELRAVARGGKPTDDPAPTGA